MNAFQFQPPWPPETPITLSGDGELRVAARTSLHLRSSLRRPVLWILVWFLLPLRETNGAFYGAGLLPPVSVSEQEHLVHVPVQLPFRSSQPIVLSYATEEGDHSNVGSLLISVAARASVDFVATRGSLTIPPGQTEASIDIPILDNGVRDGPREFHVRVSGTESNGGMSLAETIVVRIEDNELGSETDPLFLPGLVADPEREIRLSALPGGRFLARTLDGPAQPPNGPIVPRLPRLRVFGADGGENVGFALNLVQSQSRHNLDSLGFIAVTPDESIVCNGYRKDPTDRVMRILRLTPDGIIRVDSPSPISPPWLFFSFPGVQSDGKLLLLVGTQGGPQPPEFRLIRVQADGNRDTTFHEPTFAAQPLHVLIDARDRILIASDGLPDRPLMRLHPDGAVENDFPAASIQGPIYHLFELRDSSLVLLREGLEPGEVRLDAAGNTLPTAWPSVPAANGGFLWPLVQTQGGILLGSTWDSFNSGVLIGRLPNSDAPPTFVRLGLPPRQVQGLATGYGEPRTPELLATGSGLLVAGVTDVQGVPCRGVAHLRSNPPEREFRVLTPIESFRSSGVARLQVVRTGPTTNPATVHYVTTAGTAKPDVDFVPAGGRLDFAAFEVRKDVPIRLLPGDGAEERRTFTLALSDASEGYALVSATPVEVAPDLRLTIESQPRTNSGRSVFATIRGTQPGSVYWVETSTDLVRWESGKLLLATDTMTPLEPFEPAAGRTFFRVAR